MRPRILSCLVLILPLGLGCGESYQPTIRQVSVRQEGTLIATAGKNLPPAAAAKEKLTDQEDMACPGAVEHPRIRRNTEALARANDPEAAQARLLKALNAIAFDPEARNKRIEDGPDNSGQTRSEAANGNEPAGNSQEVRLAGKSLVAPIGWIREQAQTDLCLAEFRLPRVAGDPTDAQVTVSELGQDAPQSLEALKSDLEAQLPEASLEHLRIGDSNVVLVESTGESQETSDPSPEPGAEGRSRVLNATLFVGGKTYAINCSGPEKTVAERTAEFRGFLQSLKSVE